MPTREFSMDGALKDRFELLVAVKASGPKDRATLGLLGSCRFCGRTTEGRFRKKAHTFPEALGNRWIFSRDECEACNELFGRYESELSASAGPFLTLGGTPGKRNKVRQTGRSDGPIAITRKQDNEGSRISYQIGLEDRPVGTIISLCGDREVAIKVPAPNERFRPRLAYKALAKMGFALLPPEELGNFGKLRRWLLEPEDREPFPFLEVGFSYASVGNAPWLVSAALLRRASDWPALPYMIFLFCAGSACWQIDMLADTKDAHLPPLPFGLFNIEWSNVLADDAGLNPIAIRYGKPLHMDWSSSRPVATPVEWIESYFDYRTNEGSFVPRFRRMRPPQQGTNIQSSLSPKAMGRGTA